MSTRAVHILLFSKTSNHVSRHYRIHPRTEVRTLTDGLFRSRGTPRFGGPSSEHLRVLIPWCRQSGRTSDAPSPPRPPDRSPLRAALRPPVRPSSLSPSTRDGQWFPRTKTPSTNETPCGGASDPDRAVRPETSMFFARTRGPSARPTPPRGFHRRELESQTPLVSFCNATRPADTSAVLRSPSYALTPPWVTNPIKDPPARNRPMRNHIVSMRSSPMLRHSRTPSSSTALPRPWMG